MSGHFTEFPADAVTGTHILHDFNEINYAVCIASDTVGTGSGGALGNEFRNPPNLANSNLKAVETELRKLGVLATVDSNKCELVTFFRKADLQRDGARVDSILKANSCRISYRSALKAAELLNAENVDNARLYRLFIIAILHSSRPILTKSGSLIPLNGLSFVTERHGTAEQDLLNLEAAEQKKYSILNLKVQLVGSGHLLVALEEDRSTYLNRLIDLYRFNLVDRAQEIQDWRKNKFVLVLAPLGQLARYVGGHIGTLPAMKTQAVPENQVDETSPISNYDRRKQELWKIALGSWLLEQGFLLTHSPSDDWIEVEVPMFAADEQISGEPEPTETSARSVTWQPLFWPAFLCFSIPESEDGASEAEYGTPDADYPLEFAGHWLLDAEARSKALQENATINVNDEEPDEQWADMETYTRNSLPDSPAMFFRHSITEIQPGNNIYPTPPDGALSQVTPGISSFDGIDITPGDPTRNLQDVGSTFHDVEMRDVSEGQVVEGVIGSGLYDEDLFEEMPSEAFGVSEMADEPNWDFFDEQDIEMVEENEAVHGSDKLRQSKSRNNSKGFGQSEIFLSDQKDERTPERFKEQQQLNEGATFTSVAQLELDGKADLQQGNHISRVNEPGPNQEQGSPTLHLSKSPSHLATEPSSITPSPTQPIGSGRIRKHVPHRRESLVSPVQLEQNLETYDDKYSANGRFWFGNQHVGSNLLISSTGIGAVPTLGLSRKSQKAHTERRENSFNVNFNRSRTPSSGDRSGSDSSDSSDGPEFTLPRSQGNIWIDYAPPSSEIKGLDEMLNSDQEINESINKLLESFRYDFDDHLLMRPSFPIPKFSAPTLAQSDETITMTAQVLVDQITQSSLKHGLKTLELRPHASSNHSDISKELGHAFGAAEAATLQQLACLTQDSNQICGVSKLESTTVLVKRDDKLLAALPAIIPYWGFFGLQPASGPKDLITFCLYPYNINIATGTEKFLKRISEVYESNNFGKHHTGSVPDVNRGIAMWSSTETGFLDLKEACEVFGTALSPISVSDGTVLIYMINPSDAPSSLVDICEAFMALFSSYRKACGKRQPNEIYLQIVPASFVALSEAISIPTQAEYLNLAVEVYNRCPATSPGDCLASCASAVTLERSIAKPIHFDLSSKVQSPFDKSGRCLHLAYSRSSDKRWVSAAWTDNYGKIALTMSYCLWRSDTTTTRSIGEVIKELWELSGDMMNKSQSKWRLIVAVDGRLEPEETNDWLVLANQSIGKDAIVAPALTLLSFTHDPPFSLQLPAGQAKLPQSASNAQQPSGTPVSTPQAGVTSPDQLTAATPTPGGTALNAPTPPEHGFDPNVEADLILFDPTDETWSVVLSYGLNQSGTILEARPARASGYLMKRRGNADVDDAVALEVNLVHATSSTSAESKSLLKEILGQYSDLVILAKTRGMTDAASCVLPWHMATAIKGQRVLSLAL